MVRWNAVLAGRQCSAFLFKARRLGSIRNDLGLFVQNAYSSRSLCLTLFLPEMIPWDGFPFSFCSCQPFSGAREYHHSVSLAQHGCRRPQPARWVTKATAAVGTMNRFLARKLVRERVTGPPRIGLPRIDSDLRKFPTARTLLARRLRRPFRLPKRTLIRETRRLPGWIPWLLPGTLRPIVCQPD